MALSKDSKILASDFINLKNKLNAELTERRRLGSVSSYAKAYTNTPKADNPILPVHVNEIVTPMSKIDDTGLNTVASGDPVVAIDSLNSTLTTWESATMVKNGTSYCKTSCESKNKI